LNKPFLREIFQFQIGLKFAAIVFYFLHWRLPACSFLSR
jgi:hypothetical protein